MLWEFVATLVAGIGAAGIALMIRKLSKNKTPKWLIPVFAGLGILGFQVQAEYNWYAHQTSLLPDGVKVVRSVDEQAWYRPWSFVWPQTVRFMAVDTKNVATNDNHADWLMIDLYLFERRMAAKRVTQVLSCQAKAMAPFSDKLSAPDAGQGLNRDWVKLASDDPLLALLCRE
ncbi:hypothetical protein KJY73_06840 [Bowmanella sp. Y26]|uniref:hypothetical protein n=1 Tax=Bowmanella yangjiangensis TaxID=2811230 RepID=UPI001BDD1F2C|nr:hypothetical protein [Bowmanella yangjiangensis]MBT1063283.1 hypothetical protein [Bowmanella yangjiangensis]